jgi:hypothetical protein
MPTKTASPKNTAAGMTEDHAAVLHWRDHPTLRAAEQHLQRGQEALAAAEAQVTALEAEVERAKGHLHEAMVAASLGEATAAEADAARRHLEDCERRLGFRLGGLPSAPAGGNRQRHPAGVLHGGVVYFYYKEESCSRTVELCPEELH